MLPTHLLIPKRVFERLKPQSYLSNEVHCCRSLEKFHRVLEVLVYDIEEFMEQITIEEFQRF